MPSYLLARWSVKQTTQVDGLDGPSTSIGWHGLLATWIMNNDDKQQLFPQN